MLAAEPHLERWVERLGSTSSARMDSVVDEGINDPVALSRGVARWAYSAAARGGAHVWIERGRTQPLGDVWPTLLADPSPSRLPTSGAWAPAPRASRRPRSGLREIGLATVAPLLRQVVHVVNGTEG